MAELFEITGDQYTLRGEVYDDGEAILFLHAGVTDSRMWAAQIDYFSKSYQTISYDRRGFGLTESEDVPFSHLDDLILVLDHLQLDKISMVGCSQGGGLALTFAAQYPERVNKIVLIASAIPGAPFPSEFPPKIQQTIDRLNEAEDRGDNDLANEIETEIWLDGATNKAGRVSGAVRNLFLDMNGIVLAATEFSAAEKLPAIYHALSRIKTPSLVIYGDIDLPHCQANSEHLALNLNNVKKSVIANVAHLPNMEEPDKVNKLIEKFLS